MNRKKSRRKSVIPRSPPKSHLRPSLHLPLPPPPPSSPPPLTVHLTCQIGNGRPGGGAALCGRRRSHRILWVKEMRIKRSLTERNGSVAINAHWTKRNYLPQGSFANLVLLSPPFSLLAVWKRRRAHWKAMPPEETSTRITTSTTTTTTTMSSSSSISNNSNILVSVSTSILATETWCRLHKTLLCPQP